MGACALALWCAVVVAAGVHAAAYTVDCNHEYTDCDTELGKLGNEDDDLLLHTTSSSALKLLGTSPSTTPSPPMRSTPKPIIIATETINDTETITTTSVPVIDESLVKPEPRLLNLNVDELQNFANALHNQTSLKEQRKGLTDLSDVNLDDDENDEPARIMTNPDGPKRIKTISDKFYTNLQAPFHSLLSVDRGSEEMETCKENEIIYKIGERIDRGCEESCECTSGGIFECSPRCKLPYIRRGRRLNDPLCFESPVDECCSIIACASGNTDMKVMKIDVCKYGNDSYPTGAKWNIGCEQTCICEVNSIVTCKPRCKPLTQSDKCINVQDPNDACCEVQICDVSQDVHEEPLENVTTSTTTSTTMSNTPTITTSTPGLTSTPISVSTTSTSSATPEATARELENEFVEPIKSIMRPLVLSEPIGSVKVLQNNSVQVNLIHLNNTDDPIHLLLSDDGGYSFKDVELKYSNLILNLEGGKDYILKTKETDTKFNFTITASDFEASQVPREELNQVENDTMKIGCHQDGQFYAVGEEFHIGCIELCECTGQESRECAALECPSHVGLELVSKGCVRWAPSPPPQPPNCCPRTARCLSDGTCHYKGVAIPNWSEVPVSLTGCEQRCFCENGELDCQEVCTPLTPVPPQTFRCPPMHRPAAVNISDEDCCKQWGCIPNAEITVGTTINTYTGPVFNEESIGSYVMPVAPVLPTISTSMLPTPIVTTDSTDFYRHLSPVKTIHKMLIKNVHPTVSDTSSYSIETSKNLPQSDNVNVFTLEDIHSPHKITQPELPSIKNKSNWPVLPQRTDNAVSSETKTYINNNKALPTYSKKPPTANYVFSDTKMHNLIQQSKHNEAMQKNYLTLHDNINKLTEPTVKAPVVKINRYNYFLPAYNKPVSSDTSQRVNEVKANVDSQAITSSYFEPLHNRSYIVPKIPSISIPSKNKYTDQTIGIYNTHRKHVTLLQTKDVKSSRPGVTHLLTKEPNPYETVLLRPLSNTNTDLLRSYNMNEKPTPIFSKPYSTLDLEHILNQMELESEVNRNLERSADKNIPTVAGQLQTPNLPHSQTPSFLPTIPPGIHYPQDEIPDYDQNNLHRPVNSIEPSINLSPALPIAPNYVEENKKLTVISLEADSPTSVKMLFGLPPVLVGLRGSVDLRYTDKVDEEISQWYSQVFAPADEVLTTSRLEFRLTGLKPSTTYKVRGKLYLHNLPVEPESEVYTVRTQDLPTIAPAEEKRREIDSRLTVVDANDTAAHVSWRHFTEEELQFIDGIQVRYRPMGTPIYSMTELLHHSRSTAELHDLRAGSRYEASLVLVPPPRATTELHDPGRVEFTTSPYVDPYNWSVTIEARTVGSEAAELVWRGVPAPAERWVRVYRAAHACSSTRREHDAFRLATRELPPAITLTGLEPNTRCRVWLELFLTNGKVKTSNVLEIHTKSMDSPEPIDNVIEASSVAGGRGTPRGDYYGALVVVGVVAALGALTSLLLLLVVVRRHRPRSVAITSVPSAPRESSLPPYDNPAYKLELQQETMDL